MCVSVRVSLCLCLCVYVCECQIGCMPGSALKWFKWAVWLPVMMDGQGMAGHGSVIQKKGPQKKSLVVNGESI